MRVFWGVFVAAVLGAGSAWGTMVEGACITNAASATYTYAGVGKAVSYNVTACVCVGTPVVQLRKAADPTLQASGGTVTFCVSYSNKSAYMSAVNFVITDYMPANMAFAGWGEAWYVDPVMPAVVQGYTLDGVTWYWTGTPTVGTVGLRWVIPVLGMGRSGVACYLATVM